MNWAQVDDYFELDVNSGLALVTVSPSAKSFEVTVAVRGQEVETLTKKFRSVEAAQLAGQKVAAKTLKTIATEYATLAKQVKLLGKQDE